MGRARTYPWKRFWCRREDSYTLGDRGFLSDPDGEHGELLNPHVTTFDQLQAVACLALLGEPGVGKSWSLSIDVDAFRQQSPRLPLIHLDLRSFGSEDRLYKALFENQTLLQWINGDYDLHLYLDSFDECLLRIDTVAALLVDELPKLPLDRLKLRIACRTASWPMLLENALTAGYGNDNFVAAELVPLRRVDVLEAATLSGISQPDAFLERVDQLQIAALAGKPITLRMLLDTFEREGDLPGNLLDLYEKGCLILCEEQNESRRAAGRTGVLSPASRMAVAARIAEAIPDTRYRRRVIRQHAQAKGNHQDQVGEPGEVKATAMSLRSGQGGFHAEPDDKDYGQATENVESRGLNRRAPGCEQVIDSLREKGEIALGHGLPSAGAERDGLDGIGDASGHLLHGVREILLEVNGLVDEPVALVQLFLGIERLLRSSGGENLVGVLLRMDLKHRGRVDLCQHADFGL